MLEPHYHLEGIVKTRSEEMEDLLRDNAQLAKKICTDFKKRQSNH